MPSGLECTTQVDPSLDQTRILLAAVLELQVQGRYIAFCRQPRTLHHAWADTVRNGPTGHLCCRLYITATQTRTNTMHTLSA